jgi:hypothetical protein
MVSIQRIITRQECLHANIVETQRAQRHIIEPLAFSSSEHRQLSPRNATSRSIPATAIPAEYSSSLVSSSTASLHSGPAALLSSVVSSVVTTSSHWSFHISSTLLSALAEASRTSSDGTSSQSRTVVGPWRSDTSTLERQPRSSSLSVFSSSQRPSPSNQVFWAVSSDSVPLHQSEAGEISSFSLVASSTSERIFTPTGISAHTTSHVDTPQTTSQSYLSLIYSVEEETQSMSAAAHNPSKVETRIDALSRSSITPSVRPVNLASQLSSFEVLTSRHGWVASSLVHIPGAWTSFSNSAASPTPRTETSHGLQSTPSAPGTSAMYTGSLSSAPPLVPSLSPAVSKFAAETSSSAAPLRLESSAYVGLIQTRTPSSYFILSYTSSVLPSIGGGNLTFVASATPRQPIPVRASMSDFIPTSESIKGTSSVTTQPTSLSFTNDIPLGIFYSDAFGTEVSSGPSAAAISTLAVSNSALGMVALAESRATSDLNTFTNAQGARSTTVLKPTLMRSTEHVISTSASPISTVTVLVNTTSIIVSQILSESASPYKSWNSSLQTNVTQTTKSLGSVALSTGLAVDSNGAQSSTSHTFAIPGRNNFTISNTVIGNPPIISSIALASSVSRTVGQSAEISSTLLTSRSYGGLRKTVSPPDASATASANASPPLPPPLTTSQTAGVAIAGTAGILIAIVAAVYIARRYHNKRARRTGTGSVYPEVAYLYDPSTSGLDRDDSPGQAFMSGATSGLPPHEQMSRLPPNAPEHDQTHSAGTSTTRYRDPGNPYRERLEYYRYSNPSAGNSVHTPLKVVAAIASPIRGSTAASQNNPTVAEFPTTNTLRDVTCPSPALNPVGRDAALPSRSSVLEEIASMAYNHTIYSDTATLQYQPLAPYGLHSNHCLPCVRETTYSESVRDPFEHDLLLQVDSRTEIQDCATVYAPMPASDQIARTAAFDKVPLNNPWASSMLGPNASQRTARPDSRQSGNAVVSPNTTIVASERGSPAYDKHTSATYITPCQHEGTASPPLGAVHRGWDDIKRYSADKVVPPITSLSPPLGHLNSPPITKKSLPQLRRKELVPAKSKGQLLANTELALNVKNSVRPK